MPMLPFIKNQTALLWKFMGFFQSKPTRLVHAIATTLIIFGLITGWLLSSLYSPMGDSLLTILLRWTHFSFGFTVSLFGAALIITTLCHKGIKNFYPYLWGDYKQLIQDVKATLRLKLVAPREEGLAAVVQGLGLGALLLTMTSGILFFISWYADFVTATFFKDLHKLSATLLAIYFVGHGSMALIHFIDWQRKAAHKEEKSLSTYKDIYHK